MPYRVGNKKNARYSARALELYHNYQGGRKVHIVLMKGRHWIETICLVVRANLIKVYIKVSIL